MNEASPVGVDEYASLIEEAFIEPIRAVVVVDDEYPTLDGLIGKESGDNDRSWEAANTQRARDIIAFCRNEERRWMLEIHDGKPAGANTDEDAAHHLNQTDLMILDFHLNEHDQTDGSQAIEILRQLASNDHFNLVVVHTKGYGETGGTIERVVREIAVGLSQYDEDLVLRGGGLEAALDVISEWENDKPDILSNLQDQLDNGAYLMAHSSEKCNAESCKLISEFDGLFGLLDQAPDGISGKGALLLKWCIHDLQERLKGELSEVDLGKVDCRWFDGGVNWIRTDRLFVTVVGKDHAPEILPDKLLDALIRWSPAPHRLLMSKMRSELDERGVLAEGRVLGDTYLQAGWLDEYLTEDSAEREWKIRKTVSRHWESLGDALQHNLLDFASRLGSHFKSIGRDKAIRQHLPFKPNEAPHKENIATSLNKYACSKNVEGAYLSTGHVLEIVSGESTKYWLCLSPACDLVPGQKPTGWPGRLSTFTPFRAVMLFEEDRQTALASAVDGNHLFLNIGGSIQAFQFTPPIDEAADLQNRESNPKWEEMFAADQGRFSGDDCKLSLVRITSEDGELVTKSTTAKVVAQLRYEYALNLLHRLGANLSRVGLDFAPFSSPVGNDGG